MGLDSIAMISWKDGEFQEAPNEWFNGTDKLCRGCFGDYNWIRGKVYNTLIEAVTGYSLYTQLNNASLQDLSAKLNEYTEIHCASPANRVVQIPCDELKELNSWFKTAAERGCFIEAWY